MASQKDLFESQGSSQVGNGDGNEEGEEDQGGEEDMEEIVNGGRQANDYNKKTKATVHWKEGEMACIVDAMEENLDLLVGHTRGNEYRRKRITAWRNLMDRIHLWNQQQGTNVVRSYATTYKLNNLKARNE